MSRDKILMHPSSEFLALCQSQLALLSQALKASCSIVYLSEELLHEEQTKLVPVAAYPYHLAELPDFDYKIESQPRLLAAETEVLSVNRQHQLVLPLISENVVLGLLVTQREKKNWTEKELLQVKNIAHTLAIARVLDERQSWYSQALTAQEKQELIKTNKLDDFLHQLRNPITALRTFSKLLIKRLLPQDPNQKVANSMLRESDRLTELAFQFQAELGQLDASLSRSLGVRPETLMLPPSELLLEKISPAEVLEPLLNSTMAIAQERGINFIADIPPGLPSVLANRSALREVLNNLIDNGLKYTPKGGSVEVQFLEKTPENYLGIAVSDTGLGISADDQKHLFERHFRGEKATSEIKGTGLGLAIAKEMVEQMEGTIELISPNPTTNDNTLPGSLFIVWLKVEKEVRSQKF